MSYASKRLWIISVDSETGRYTPTYVRVAEYKQVTGLKTIIGWQSYEDCLKVCQKRNKEEGRYHNLKSL